MHCSLLFLTLAFVLAAAVQPAPGQPSAETPIASGWTGGPAGTGYEAALDRNTVHGGHASVWIKSSNGGAQNYAVRQRIRADAYRGKRVRFSGWLKPDASEGGALWMRIDMPNGDYILDGMLELTGKEQSIRWVKGWTRCDLVAQVPADALGISIGVRMRGKGEVHADDLSFEVVSAAVATNTIERRPYRAGGDKEAALRLMREQYAQAPASPVNLGFENP